MQSFTANEPLKLLEFSTDLSVSQLNSMCMAHRIPSIHLALVEDGDLVCWNCHARLISGYARMIQECGPVPYFSEITMMCLECAMLNRAQTCSANPAGSDTAS